MIKVNIKPLSVNKVWRGRRFKTDEYKNYERLLLLTLKPMKLPESPYRVYYEFGFSSAASDIDNPVKPFQDILSKKYGFDDKLIHEMNVKRAKVKKGEEYIKFKIESIMTEIRVKCTSCNCGATKHNITGETMHVAIELKPTDMIGQNGNTQILRPCPNEKCKAQTLVKA